MMRDTIADLHRAVGVELVPAITTAGHTSDRVFFGPGRVRVRLITRIRAALAVLFGRDSGRDGGILIVDAGRDRDGGPTAPMVILDWGTYIQLVLGLKRQKLPDLGMAGSPEDLAGAEFDAAKHETGGGTFQ